MSGKKILVLSDTHGGITSLTTVLSWANERLPPNDTIVAAAFLGDGISDLSYATDATGFSCNWKIVRGNNDYEHSVPGTEVFDFCGYRFFMTHGHRYNLYSSYHGLIYAARENNADIVLFGHTHVPYCKNADGLLLVNPGSVSSARSRIGESFAVLECIEGKPLNAEFWGIDRRGKISLLAL